MVPPRCRCAGGSEGDGSCHGSRHGRIWHIPDTDKYLAKEEPEYQLPLDCLKVLAFKDHISEEKIKAVVQGFSLFDLEGDFFYSRSLLRRMDTYDTIRQKNGKRLRNDGQK